MLPPLRLHGDHSKSIKDFARNGIPIYSNNSVANKHGGVAVLEERQPYRIGSFIVTAYKAYHDVECYGFLIQHKEMGRLLFFTDTSQVPYKFRDIQHILIEANSDEEYMVTNAMDNIWSRSSHNNHLSLNKAINFVITNKSVTLQNVILIHLSEGNADPKMFRQRFREEVGIEPIVAKKGLTMKLNREEF